jgi:phosphoglycolate phosphatase-like HAD superfamily hydrolase
MGSRIIPRMAQFGATTMIGPDIRLLLLDCFETIVEMEKGVYRPRLGIIDFLTHFGARVGIPIAVVSDASLKAVTQALGQAQLASYFVTVYHADNAAEELGEGRKRKRLDLPVAEFKIRANQTLFIGDSPLDAEAAQHYGVQFIRVPRSEDRSFSFANLITGPSRYRSQEFNVTFLDHYRKDKK